MAINFISSFLISSFLTFLIIVHPTLANQIGFSTNLIHRESPESPLSISSLNPYDRVRNSIQRSISRINRFKTTQSGDVEAQVDSSNGEYLMELSFGTPPVKQLVIVDTGSDLIWTQCQPCLECYEQVIPIFDPRKSSTYKVQSCHSKACKALDKDLVSCFRKNTTCGYTYKYGDRSETRGDIATETITFNSEGQSKGVSFPGIDFGCGHNNSGTFRKYGSGLVGLGAGPLSLVSQLGSSIGGKFSYCLIPFSHQGNHTSTINFGTKGEVSGHGVISTPIVKGHTVTFYYLTLNEISIGDSSSKIPFYKKSSDGDYDSPTAKGNIIIDSGTTLTFLPEEVYSDLSNALARAIKADLIDDPTGQLTLCYQITDDLVIPDITFHFDGGDLVLKSSHTFAITADEVMCLAIVPSDNLAILGYIAQMNYLVGYDTENATVSFKPTDCSKAQD